LRSQQAARLVSQPMEQGRVTEYMEGRVMEDMEGRLQAQEVFWKQQMKSLEQRLEAERVEMEQQIASLTRSLEEEQKQRRKERKRMKRRERKKKAAKERKETPNAREKEKKVDEFVDTEKRGSTNLKENRTRRLNGSREFDRQAEEIVPAKQEQVEKVQVRGLVILTWQQSKE
jgi:hypothetical protein